MEKLPSEILHTRNKMETNFRIFEKYKGIHTKNESSLRTFIEAVWYMVRSGCQWRLLPEIYGNYRSIHVRFKKWCEKGVWEKLLKHTQQDPDLEVSIIDETIVKAHACSAGYEKDSWTEESLGRSKGGFSTKIHAVFFAWNPLSF